MQLTSGPFFHPPRPERGVFLLLGVSGSGKGSVGARLLEDGVIEAHEGMGAWLRAAIHDPRDLEPRLAPLQPDGFDKLEYLEHCLTNGLLIPDAWTEAVVEWKLERAQHSVWALDGFPRTVGAARHLLEALEAAGIALLGAVELCVPQAVVLERLAARGRGDDTPEAIERRLEFYAQSVRPALAWLEAAGVPVHRVDASQTLETVVEDVKNRLGL
jgi:adenylate kinase